MPATPTVTNPGKRKLELIDQKRKLNAALSEARASLDDHARGERYGKVAEVAATIANQARIAEQVTSELNRILDAEWERRRG